MPTHSKRHPSKSGDLKIVAQNSDTIRILCLHRSVASCQIIMSFSSYLNA